MVVLLELARRNTDDSDDELHDDHASPTDDKNLAAAEPLDGPEGKRGGADVNEGGDEGDQEGVFDAA